MIHLIFEALWRMLCSLPIVSEFVFQMMGIPVAAKFYLANFGRQDSVYVRVAGRKTLLTCNYEVSKRVFKGNGHNYTSRMAEDAGLARIGMLNQGIIWNNRTTEWKRLRHYFQCAVDAKALKTVTLLTYGACDLITTQFPPFNRVFQEGGKVDLLDFLRQVTLEVTNR